MGRNVEERVVEMQFNNSNFERNAQESINTLGRLRKSLNFEGATQGFDDIGNAAQKCNMPGLGSAVEAVQARFSALQSIALGALMRIGSQAVQTGERMLRSLTIAPIHEGFNEYELKMGSVQTIMASTGEDLSTVNKYLADLNKYSDQTIYSFRDMTSSIGKFTNAGVSLEDAVMAIKGISNEAAVSGANAQEASRAMYNFAQALSAGSVKLIDWKSIENANMATVEFKENLIKTAVEMGTLVEQDGKYVSTTTDLAGKTARAFDATSAFNESLSSQWMTTDVLIKTLNEYADENTEIGKKASQAATEVKTFSQLMDTLKEAVGSGWAETWELIFGDFEEAKALWTDVNNVMSDIIDRQSEMRNSLLRGWHDGGGRVALIEALKNAYSGLLTVIEPVKKAFRDIFPDPDEGYMVVEAASTGARKLVALTEQFRDFTAKLKLSDTASQNLRDAFGGLFSVIKLVKTAFFNATKAASPLIDLIVYLGGKILWLAGTVGRWITKTSESIMQSGLLNSIFSSLTKYIGMAEEGFESFADRILNSDILGFFGTAWEKVTGFFESIFEYTNKFTNNGGIFGFIDLIWKKVTSVGEAIVGYVGNMMTNISQSFGGENAFDFFNSATLGTIAVSILSFVKSLKKPLDSISGFKESLLGILNGVKDCFAAYQEQLKAGTLIKIAGAIAILAASLVIIAAIDANKLATSLGAITALFADLIVASALVGKIGGSFKTALKVIPLMVATASSILVLSAALAVISSIDTDKLRNSVFAITALMTVMVTAAKVLATGSKHMMSGASKMIALSVAVLILAQACKNLSVVPWDEMENGLIGLGVIMGILVAGMRLMPKNLVGIGFGLIGVSAAMLILGKAVASIGAIPLEQLDIGLKGLAASLIIIAAAMNVMPKNMIAIGLGLIAVGGALNIIGLAMRTMGNFTDDQMANSIMMLGTSLAFLAVALNLMNGTIGGAAAMLVAAGALAILAPILMLLGTMSLPSLLISLGALAGVFTIFGVAGYALGPVIGIIIGLSASIMMLGTAALATGAGFALVGVGIAAIVTSLSALAAIGAAGATAIMAALTVILTGLIGFIPQVVTGIATGIITFAKTIGEGAAIIADSLLKVITEILESLVEYTPRIIDALFQFLVGILEGLARNLPALMKGVVDVLMGFFAGVVDALGAIDPEILVKGIAGVGFISALMLALAAMAILTPLAMIGVLGLGLVVAEMTMVLSAMSSLAQIPGIQEMVADGGAFLMLVGTAIGQFIGGLVGGFAEGFSASLPEIGKNLSDFIVTASPFIEGAKNIDSTALDGIQNLAAMILLICGVEILDSISSWLTGESSLSDFAKELVPFGRSMSRYSNTVKGIDTEAVEASATAGKALAELAANLPNSGGLVGWFMGENDIDDFGDKIVVFGRAIARYSRSINGIDTDAVSNSATAGKALAELAASLPNTGGVVSWFTGDNAIDDFGTKLEAFGASIMAYSNKVTGIDDTAMDRSIEFIKTLNSFSDSTIGLIDSFSDSLMSIAVVGVDSFIGVFTDAKQDAIDAGETLMENFQDGIDNETMPTKQAIIDIVNTCITTLNDGYDNFYSAGAYLVGGFATAITDHTWLGSDAARQVAYEANKAMTDELDEHSPSKKSYQSGVYYVVGFANALIAYQKLVYESSRGIGKEAHHGLEDSINDISDILQGIDAFNPVIRPTLDLSAVESASKGISKLISPDYSIALAASTNFGLSRNVGYSENTEPVQTSTVNNFNYTQNNTSPKALSRWDIYRDTQKQLRTVRRVFG